MTEPQTLYRRWRREFDEEMKQVSLIDAASVDTPRSIRFQLACELRIMEAVRSGMTQAEVID